MSNAPIPIDRQVATMQIAGLAPGSHIVDIGCGTAELLIALAHQGFVGTGVDLDAKLIAAAEQSRGSLPVEILCADATSFAIPKTDAIVCVGATHAYGSGPRALPNALRVFRETLGPGGVALIGEGFHQQPIPDEYTTLLGSPSGIERTHLENVQTCEAQGFECLHAITATDDEWDAFEWAFYRRSRSADPKGARTWRDGYLRWGRQTMGFACTCCRCGDSLRTSLLTRAMNRHALGARSRNHQHRARPLGSDS